MSNKAPNKTVRELCITQVHDVLDNIVPKRVLNKGQSVMYDFLDQLCLNPTYLAPSDARSQSPNRDSPFGVPPKNQCIAVTHSIHDDASQPGHNSRSRRRK